MQNDCMPARRGLISIPSLKMIAALAGGAFQCLSCDFPADPVFGSS